MRKGRRTPIYERKLLNFPITAISKSPIPKSTGLKSLTPSIPTALNAALKPQTLALGIKKQSEQVEEMNKLKYYSSKERMLINKIITLKREKKEIIVNFQRHESILKQEIEKAKSDNETLKGRMQKIILLIDESVSPRVKMQIQDSLNKFSVSEYGTQCDLPSTDNDSTALNLKKEPFTTEEIKRMREIEEENEQLKAYSMFAIKNKIRHSVQPNFIKSLYISDLS